MPTRGERVVPGLPADPETPAELAREFADQLPDQDRFPSARRLSAGQPVIVVRNGEMQREEGIRDLREVELAVLETDGRISFFTGAGRR